MNRASFWATQETGPVAVPDWSNYEMSWARNKDRWQLLEEDPPTQPALQETFDKDWVGEKTFMSLEKTTEGVSLTPEMTLYIKRLFVVWKQDADPRSPLTADLSEAVALSEEDYELNQAAWQLLVQTVGTWMQGQDKPLVVSQG